MHSSYRSHRRLSAEARALQRPPESEHPDADAAARALLLDLGSEDSPALSEVDARSITGNGGTVTLYLTASSEPARFLVVIASAEGEQIAAIAAETSAEALEAYQHPFARPEVPDIFATAAA